MDTPEASHLVAVCQLVYADEPRFTSLAALSGLPSLEDDAHRRFLLRHGIVIGAVGLSGDLIGCCCIELCATHSYVQLSGRTVPMPLPNAYLCGAFVHPAHRGRGIGSMIYARRLEVATRSGAGFIVVEILGDGTPYSVSRGARPGLFFHVRAGFAVDGYSPAEDRGPVLIRRTSAG
jgi:GNAT superfamily N-acetyltransferase